MAEQSKSKSGKTSRELDLVGFLARLAATTMLIMATYNPTGYSFTHWVKTAFANDALGPAQFVVGVLLIIGWIILLSATYRSMGLLGLILGAALFGGVVWLLSDMELLNIDTSSEWSWTILIILSLVLAIGLSWSHVWRRLTGQFEVDSE